MSKVLLCYDVKGWAWHHKAKALKKYIGDKFTTFDIMSSKKFTPKLFSKYNSVHFFGYMEGRKYAGKYKGVTAGVSSHNFIYKHLEKAKKIMPKYDALTCTSQILYKELVERKMNKNIYYCPNGVDETIFTPGEKTENLDKFTVGWMGQPTKGSLADDAHGYTHILLPLIESLKDVKEIKFNVLAKTFKNASPHANMPAWYRELDLFIHTGYSTGTPNPLFEAQACGIPGISTAIGAAPELFSNPYNGFLVPRYHNEKEAKERVKLIGEQICYWRYHRKNLEVMSENARKIIVSDWTWKERSRNWIPVFEKHGKKL